jgi:hypothetical protein
LARISNAAKGRRWNRLGAIRDDWLTGNNKNSRENAFGNSLFHPYTNDATIISPVEGTLDGSIRPLYEPGLNA